MYYDNNVKLLISHTIYNLKFKTIIFKIKNNYF